MVRSAADLEDREEASASPAPSAAFCRLWGCQMGFLTLGCFLRVLWWLRSGSDGSFILISFWLALQVGSAYALH